MQRYLTSNLWDAFKQDCPFFALIPFVRMWAFGHYVYGYFAHKSPLSDGDTP